MNCTICRSPIRAEIIEEWAVSGSLRKSANQYGVGYRSLQRHLDLCLASILAEREQQDYEAALLDAVVGVRARLGVKKIKNKNS
jgi:hypothetical protein